MMTCPSPVDSPTTVRRPRPTTTIPRCLPHPTVDPPLRPIVPPREQVLLRQCRSISVSVEASRTTIIIANNPKSPKIRLDPPDKDWDRPCVGPFKPLIRRRLPHSINNTCTEATSMDIPFPNSARRLVLLCHPHHCVDGPSNSDLRLLRPVVRNPVMKHRCDPDRHLPPVSRRPRICVPMMIPRPAVSPDKVGLDPRRKASR